VTTAKAAIDLLVRAEKHRRPREVEVEVEDVEIDAAHVEHADEDELLRQRRNLFGKTNNLLVEGARVHSVLATEDDEERFIRQSSEALRFRIIGPPGRGGSRTIRR